MIEHWSRGDADEHMPEAILVELASIIRRHPWWQARAALTLELLEDLGLTPPARVLDVGCGWGVTLDALEQRGYRAIGMDVSLRTLQQLDRPGRTLIEADLTRPMAQDSPAHDAVLALDVIEHLDDDGAAVRRLGTLTTPGGIVVVSVPALPGILRRIRQDPGPSAAIPSPRVYARPSRTRGWNWNASSGGAAGWSRPSRGSGRRAG